MEGKEAGQNGFEKGKWQWKEHEQPSPALERKKGKQ